MSTWTHITGSIRIDDFNSFAGKSTDFSKVFIRNTWDHRNSNGNLPTGSEGSIDVEFIERPENEGAEYQKTICFFGDLRDFNKEDCQNVKKWWYNIPDTLSKYCMIRQAVLQVQCEDGYECILTEKDMNIKEDEDE